MGDSRWVQIDGRARDAKRALVVGARRYVKISRQHAADRAGDARHTMARIARRARHEWSIVRRWWKIPTERTRKRALASVNILRKMWRRLVAVPERLRQRARRLQKANERFATYRAEWAIERDIAAAVRGDGPIVVGPWLSEVGYEVLYWVPFVRWVQLRYKLKPDRLVVATRGGAAAWYADIASTAVDVFDLIDPATYAARNEQRAADGTGTLKQFGISDLDREILEAIRARSGAPRARVLHPSLLYRLFHQFWLGHRPQGFYDSHMRHRLIAPPAVGVPQDLPDRYVAAKFYTAMSLPPTPAVRRTIQSLVLAIADKTPVVMLETGFTLDDHHDHDLDVASRIYTVRGRVEARDNLAVQTAIIARAERFVGTCGSVAWLAPMLGVDTTAVMSEPRFLHQHLQVARRVYQSLEGAGRFSVLDIGAFEQLGLTPRLHFQSEPTA